MKNIKRDLSLIFNSKYLLPKYILERNHEDYLPGLRWIPRRWTSYPFPFPSFIVSGNAKPSWVPWRGPEGYPISDKAEIREVQPYDWNGRMVTKEILCMDAVHPVGQWSIQGVELFGKIIPCYITATFRVFGFEIYGNIGVKSDWVDPHFATPEASLTIKKKNDPA